MFQPLSFHLEPLAYDIISFGPCKYLTIFLTYLFFFSSGIYNAYISGWGQVTDPKMTADVVKPTLKDSRWVLMHFHINMTKPHQTNPNRIKVMIMIMLLGMDTNLWWRWRRNMGDSQFTQRGGNDSDLR